MASDKGPHIARDAGIKFGTKYWVPTGGSQRIYSNRISCLLLLFWAHTGPQFTRYMTMSFCPVLSCPVKKEWMEMLCVVNTGDIYSSCFGPTCSLLNSLLYVTMSSCPVKKQWMEMLCVGNNGKILDESCQRAAKAAKMAASTAFCTIARHICNLSYISQLSKQICMQ